MEAADTIRLYYRQSLHEALDFMKHVTMSYKTGRNVVCLVILWILSFFSIQIGKVIF